MKTIRTYYKNSNTGDILLEQKHIETKIDFPVCYFNPQTKELIGEDIKLEGYVKISEKKIKRILRNL